MATNGIHDVHDELARRLRRTVSDLHRRAKDDLGPTSAFAWNYPYATPQPTLNARTWAGVQLLLDNYCDLAPGHAVLVAYTPDSVDVAAWVTVAAEERCTSVEAMPMRPITDETLQDRLEHVLGSLPQHAPLRLLTFEAHTMSHGSAFRAALRRDPRSLGVRTINAGEDVLTQGVVIGPDQLDRRNRELIAHLSRASRLAISTTAGTELTVCLDSERFRWINNAGTARPGQFVVLPAGEIATHPGSITGRFVGDFAVHANVPVDLDCRLASAPIVVDIVDGSVTDWHCADDAMAALVGSWLAEENATRVGELGFGTNLGVTEAVRGNSHVNERNPAVHLGLGQHNQSAAAAGYSCDLHIDLIAADGVVTTDDGVEIDLRATIPPCPGLGSIEADPEDVRSEDDPAERGGRL